MNNPHVYPLTPILPLLEDPEITEVMIDGWQRVYVEKHSKLQDVPTPFQSDADVYALIDCIAEPLGKVVNESYPYAEARLADGTRFNAVVPPIAIGGPSVTLRKAIRREEITVERLVTWGSISKQMAEFLRACVLSRLNIVVAGGTASGKTTLLHVLARWIPESERIIVLQHEDFHLRQKRVVNLETRPANIEGRGAVTMRDLVENSARMRPDRIIVSEVSGGETFDLLTLMNSGHDGTSFSLHASSVSDALARLLVMAQLGNPSFPLPGLRELLASAIDVILYQERMPDGTRKIIKIAEVAGVDNGAIVTHDLFEFHRTGRSEDRIQGFFSATGVIPQFIQRLEDVGGVGNPFTMFTVRQG